jgi:DNA-directed RNA polymerase specialized sigma subunit
LACDWSTKMSYKKLRKASKKMEPRELENLVKRLRDGDTDPTIKERIIAHHMGLALTIGNRVAKKYGRDPNDIQAEAMYALVAAVGRASTALYDNNITPYLRKTLLEQCKKYVKKDRIFGVSESDLTDTSIAIPIREELRNEHLARNFLNMVELEDELNALLDPLERLIIEKRMECFTDEEIGAEIYRSREYINRLRTKAVSKLLDHDMIKELKRVA